MPSPPFAARRIPRAPALLVAFLLGLGATTVRADRGYVVREGDTLLSIAKRRRVEVAELRRANKLKSDLLRPGMRLRVPSRSAPSEERRSIPASPRKEAKQVAEALGLGSSRVAQRLLFESPEPRWIEAAGEPELEKTLRLPVDGAIFFRGYGSGYGGYHRALDLGAPRGTPIVAAARGIVAFAGRALRGYGNLVIVVHPEGTTTWYAHNHRNLVVAGQKVERGDVLGTVGTTGYADGPHVHFMLVHEGQHCDPLPLVRPNATRAPETALLEWAEGRPPELQCAPKTEETSHPKRRRKKRRRR